MNGIQTGRHQAHNIPWEGRWLENRPDSSDRRELDLSLGPKNCCGSAEMRPCFRTSSPRTRTEVRFPREMTRLKFDRLPFGNLVHAETVKPGERRRYRGASERLFTLAISGRNSGRGHPHDRWEGGEYESSLRVGPTEGRGVTCNSTSSVRIQNLIRQIGEDRRTRRFSSK
jgi:hypothetical protein